MLGVREVAQCGCGISWQLETTHHAQINIIFLNVILGHTFKNVMVNHIGFVFCMERIMFRVHVTVDSNALHLFTLPLCLSKIYRPVAQLGKDITLVSLDDVIPLKSTEVEIRGNVLTWYNFWFENSDFLVF